MNKHSLCTHYVYETRFDTGDFYIGIHSWNGAGLDPSYSTSSRKVNSFISRGLTATHRILVSAVTTDKSSWYIVRKALYICEQEKIKASFNHPKNLNGWWDEPVLPIHEVVSKAPLQKVGRRRRQGLETLLANITLMTND